MELLGPVVKEASNSERAAKSQMTVRDEREIEKLQKQVQPLTKLILGNAQSSHLAMSILLTVHQLRTDDVTVEVAKQAVRTCLDTRKGMKARDMSTEESRSQLGHLGVHIVNAMISQTMKMVSLSGCKSKVEQELASWRAGEDLGVDSCPHPSLQGEAHVSQWAQQSRSGHTFRAPRDAREGFRTIAERAVDVYSHVPAGGEQDDARTTHGTSLDKQSGVTVPGDIARTRGDVSNLQVATPAGETSGEVGRISVFDDKLSEAADISGEVEGIAICNDTSSEIALCDTRMTRGMANTLKIDLIPSARHAHESDESEMSAQ